jgi:thioester reductase-like protein
MSQTTLVTGYPGFIAKRLVPKLAEEGGGLTVLVEPSAAEAARRALAELPRATGVEVLEGDVSKMHLGLSGAEYKKLVGSVAEIWHLAASDDLAADRAALWRVNVEGTHNVLELARVVPGLVRFNHFSSAFVSGDRAGVIGEEELETGQGFGNAYEESKLQAELLLRRAMPEIPATIYRPGIVVGDTATGQLDRLDGPYYSALRLVSSPLTTPLPLPDGGGAPLHLVPVDFVVEAAVGLSRDARALARCFHLVDPSPMSARMIYEHAARRARRKLPALTYSHRTADRLLRLPGLEKLARPQRAAIQGVSRLAFYRCGGILELLADGPWCPPVESYLDKLLDAVVTHQQRRRDARAASEAEDPLDPDPEPFRGMNRAP